MALQRMILVPPELTENYSQQSPPPPPATKLLKSKNDSHNKWTQVRVLQDPYLKSENQKRKTIPIIESDSTKPSFKTKRKRERVIGSVTV